MATAVRPSHTQNTDVLAAALKASDNAQILPPQILQEKNEKGIVTRQYARGVLLGKGGFARCYEYREISSDKVYAVKTIVKSSLNTADKREKLKSEVAIHSKLHHPNVVQFVRSFSTSQFYCIVLEKCSNATLAELLYERVRLTEPEIKYYGKQIIEGVAYLHSKKVIHRDLKLGNLFLDDSLTIKIGDLGLAAMLKEEENRRFTPCGTPNYVAPEVLGKNGHSFEADIWSLGVILYTLAVGKPPFEVRTKDKGADRKEITKRIVEGKFSWPSETSLPLSQHFKMLVNSLLKTNPDHRPSLSDLEFSPFFDPQTIPVSLPLSSLKSKPVSFTFPQREEDRMQQMELERQKQEQEQKKLQQLLEQQRLQQQQQQQQQLLLEQKRKQQLLEQQRIQQQQQQQQQLQEQLHKERAAKGMSAYEMIRVKEFKDFSQGYGLVFELTDGTFGITFNDNTVMALSPNEVDIEYNTTSRETHRMSINSFPPECKKKVQLLQYFKKNHNDRSNRNSIDDSTLDVTYATQQMSLNERKHLVYIQKFINTRHAMFFRLSNKTIQVNFTDNSVLHLVAEGDYLSYTNPSGKTREYLLDDIIAPDPTYHVALRCRTPLPPESRNELLKKLNYTKDVLAQFLAPGAVSSPK